MSTNTPSGPPGEPEYIGSDTGSAAAPPARRWGVLAASTAAVLGVVALGGWGAYALLAGGGDQPAAVIPADAVGYVSLDLDPSAAQKIEAISILNKFPALEKELDISSQADLRKVVFTSIQEDGGCANLDYDNDIKPWIGDRVAVAGASVGGDPAPLVALQITDEEAATAGIDALAECSESKDAGGYAFLDGYVLISDSEEHASALAAAAEKSSLADDPDFQTWMDRIGDPGIVTAYVAPEGPKYLLDLMSDQQNGMFEGEDLGRELDGMRDEVTQQLADFDGGAAVIRFENGALEAEFAGKGLARGAAALADVGGTPITDLPASTGIAFAAGLSEGWLQDALTGVSGAQGKSAEDLMREVEAETGLELPEDVEALLGEGFAVAVDADVDVAGLMRGGDPSQLPVGLRVVGDPDEILPVVEKIKPQLGPAAGMLVVESGEGVVAFGTNPGYTKKLLEGGSLGEDESFGNVVPDADAANGVFYVNFDAGDGWAESLAVTMGDLMGGRGAAEAQKNVAPLDALGVSGWTDSDGVQRGLVRLTTD